METHKLFLQLGFSEPEAMIYHFLLSHSSLTKEQIIEQLNLSALTVSASLEALLKKSVITSIREETGVMYSAEHPDKVIAHFEQELAHYSSSLEKLKAQKQILEGAMSTDRPRVRFFQGKPGLLSMLDEFNTMEKPTALLMYSPEHVREAFTDAEREKQIAARKERIITTESICFSVQNTLPDLPYVQRALVPLEKYPFSIDVEIYDDKVAIASLVNEQYGVIIESKEIANSFRSIFRLAIKGAEQEKKKG